MVTNPDDCITAAGNALKTNVVPIFCVSSVTGSGLDLAKKFLHLLGTTMDKIQDHYGPKLIARVSFMLNSQYCPVF